MTAPSIEALIQQAEHKQHPFGKVWQKFDDQMFAELVANIDSRGLDKDIVLYQGMVLEGWHRYLACIHTKVTPKFTDFKGDDLQAAELVHASGIRRHSNADQRYASFVMLCESCAAFKDKYEKLKSKGEQQQKEGKPLDTDAQRVDVLKAKAEAANVGKTTAKKVEKIVKANPAAVADIAAGKTTANKELEKLNTAKSKGQSKTNKKDGKEVASNLPHLFSIEKAGSMSVKVEEPGRFKVQLKDSVKGEIVVTILRKPIEKLQSQLTKAIEEDDGNESDELPK